MVGTYPSMQKWLPMQQIDPTQQNKINAANFAAYAMNPPSHHCVIFTQTDITHKVLKIDTLCQV